LAGGTNVFVGRLLRKACRADRVGSADSPDLHRRRAQQAVPEAQQKELPTWIALNVVAGLAACRETIEGGF